MAHHRHLEKAPLREALVDIQFVAVPLELIDQFVAAVAPEYATTTNIWEALVLVNAEDESITPTKTALGRRLTSENGLYVLQVRTQGFTLSRLPPYVAWPDLRAEAARLWDAFVGILGNVQVNRLAVRYINNLRLPTPLDDFSDFLVAPPTVPAALPQALAGFLTRVIIPDDETESTAIVTQVYEAPSEEVDGKIVVPVILDIDVFRTHDVDGHDQQIWQCLDQLRDQKNKMFFEHITERTAELYE